MSNSETDQLLPAMARMMVPGPEYDLIEQYVGEWHVQQRMWPDNSPEPIVAEPMIARRELVRGAFLQEVMEAAPGTTQDPFTRIAYLCFNNLNRRFEYLSIDSRAPGMMFETTFDDVLESPNTITVYLNNFALAGWGAELTGELYKQRRVLTVHDADSTSCQQYWTPPAGKPFLAVEYIYTRI